MSPEARLHVVAEELLSQTPARLERHDAFSLVAILRPEEGDVCSGINNIVKPFLEGHGEAD